MKKLVFISICVLSLAFAGSAATSGSLNSKPQVKKEAPATKKATAKKATAKKATAKKVAKSPVTPAAPIKK